MIRRWIFGSAALVGALALTLAAPGDAHARRSRCCGCNQYAYAGGMTQAYGTGGAVNGATDGIAPQAYGIQGYGGAGYDGAGYGGAGYGAPGYGAQGGYWRHGRYHYYNNGAAVNGGVRQNGAVQGQVNGSVQGQTNRPSAPASGANRTNE